jgi:hypothetical protein
VERGLNNRTCDEPESAVMILNDQKNCNNDKKQGLSSSVAVPVCPVCPVCPVFRSCPWLVERGLNNRTCDEPESAVMILNDQKNCNNDKKQGMSTSVAVPV